MRLSPPLTAALDQYLANPVSDTFDLPDDVIEELNRTSHRHYSPGFYFGKEQALQTPSHTYVRDWDFIGTVDVGEGRCPLHPAQQVLPGGFAGNFAARWLGRARNP